MTCRIYLGGLLLEVVAVVVVVVVVVVGVAAWSSPAVLVSGWFCLFPICSSTAALMQFN